MANGFYKIVYNKIGKAFWNNNSVVLNKNIKYYWKKKSWKLIPITYHKLYVLLI